MRIKNLSIFLSLISSLIFLNEPLLSTDSFSLTSEKEKESQPRRTPQEEAIYGSYKNFRGAAFSNAVSVKRLLIGKRYGPHDGIYEIQDNNETVIAKVMHIETVKKGDIEVNWYDGLEKGDGGILSTLQKMEKLPDNYNFPRIVHYLGKMTNVPLDERTNNGTVLLFEKARGKELESVIVDIFKEDNDTQIQRTFSKLGEALGKFYMWNSKIHLTFDDVTSDVSEMKLIGLSNNDPAPVNIFYNDSTGKVTFIDYAGLEYGKEILNTTAYFMNGVAGRIRTTLKNAKDTQIQSTVLKNIPIMLSSFFDSFLSQFKYIIKDNNGAIHLEDGEASQNNNIATIIKIKKSIIQLAMLEGFIKNISLIESDLLANSKASGQEIDEGKKQLLREVGVLEQKINNEIKQLLTKVDSLKGECDTVINSDMKIFETYFTYD